MRAVFDRISPIHQVERMRAPLLVMAGANDVRVPVSESRAIVSRIREAGGEAWLLIAKDEGHGFYKLGNQIAAARVRAEFLQRVFGLSARPSGDAR